MDTNGDFDSGLEDDYTVYTDSLGSSLLVSVIENGRGYHRYQDGQYFLPEDEREQERLELQHHMFSRTFNDRLILAPIDIELLQVLDIGTGTGLWAIEFADQNPQASVIGIDLSPIQPTYLPPNCRFRVDDFETEWWFQQRFDLIHGRMLATSSSDFSRLFRQAYDYLNPGGWLEMQDCSMSLQCIDGTLVGTTLAKWSDLLTSACQAVGRDPHWTCQYKDWMREAGFENVEERVFTWPIGSWVTDERLKELGQWSLSNMLEGLEGFTMRLFTRVLGWTVDEIHVFLAAVRQDLRSGKIHAAWPIVVAYGKKPRQPPRLEDYQQH